MGFASVAPLPTTSSSITAWGPARGGRTPSRSLCLGVHFVDFSAHLGRDRGPIKPRSHLISTARWTPSASGCSAVDLMHQVLMREW